MATTSTLTKGRVRREESGGDAAPLGNMPLLKKVLYVVGAVALLAGLWGLFSRFAYGERDVNYGSYVNWGLWVAMYLFFGAIAAGSIMMASLDYLFQVPLFRGTGKVALWGAVVTLPAGLASIAMDLGHMERIWKVYLQPNFGSVMAQLVWGYTAFFILAVVMLWMALRRPAAEQTSVPMKVLMGVGLVLAVFLSGGVGALLGVNASRPFWHIGLFPVQFPVFSLASGAAMMLVVLGFFAPRDDPKRAQQLWVLSVASVVLHVAKLYFMWSDYSQSIYGNMPMNVEAVNQVLWGRYWWVFWILQVGIGTLIPIVVLSQRKLATSNGWAGWMGILVLAGYAVARALIIFPALTVPEFEALARAFTGPHLSYDYLPSLMEWSVTVGVIGAAALAFMLGTDLLPLFRAEKSSREVAK